MRNGLILDAGVLQGLAKERAPITPFADHLRREPLRLVTIREVTAECINVPFTVLDDLHVQVETTRTPHGPIKLLDAFSAGPRSVWWSIDGMSRADRAVVGHAIAGGYDIVTTDRAMKDRSFREFLRRLDQLADEKLPAWHIPEIVVVRATRLH